MQITNAPQACITTSKKKSWQTSLRMLQLFGGFIYKIQTTQTPIWIQTSGFVKCIQGSKICVNVSFSNGIQCSSQMYDGLIKAIFIWMNPSINRLSVFLVFKQSLTIVEKPTHSQYIPIWHMVSVNGKLGLYFLENDHGNPDTHMKKVIIFLRDLGSFCLARNLSFHT